MKLNDNQATEFGSQIIAIVNLKIKEYTYSGSIVDKVTCILGGKSGSKDDSSVYKGLKKYSYAKNIEFRL